MAHRMNCGRSTRSHPVALERVNQEYPSFRRANVEKGLKTCDTYRYSGNNNDFLSGDMVITHNYDNVILLCVDARLLLLDTVCWS